MRRIFNRFLRLRCSSNKLFRSQELRGLEDIKNNFSVLQRAPQLVHPVLEPLPKLLRAPVRLLQVRQLPHGAAALEVARVGVRRGVARQPELERLLVEVSYFQFRALAYWLEGLWPGVQDPELVGPGCLFVDEFLLWGDGELPLQ